MCLNCGIVESRDSDSPHTCSALCGLSHDCVVTSRLVTHPESKTNTEVDTYLILHDLPHFLLTLALFFIIMFLHLYE